MAVSSGEVVLTPRRKASATNEALRDALVELMQKAGTSLSASEAEVLVKALSSEMRRPLERTPSFGSPASSSSRLMKAAGPASATTTAHGTPVSTRSKSETHPPVARSPGSSGASLAQAIAKKTSSDAGNPADDIDGGLPRSHNVVDSVGSLPQRAEAVYGDPDDGYQSTSGTVVANDRLPGAQYACAVEMDDITSDLLAKHQEVATVFEQHPELVDFVTELMSRQGELETALSRTEHELRRREQEHLQHVQYLEDLSLAQIEQANRRAQQATEAARRGAALLSPEAAYDKLVQELNDKEKQLKQLKVQQDKLRVEMKEKDYQHSQAHGDYAGEQQQLLQELTGMRRTLHDIRQRSMRRKRHTKVNKSASLLVEEFAKLAADKTDEALALKAELEARNRQDADYSDLQGQSQQFVQVQSPMGLAVSRTSSILDKYVDSNGPANAMDTIVFHPIPLAASTPGADAFLADSAEDDENDDIITKLTGANQMKTKSLDDLLTEKKENRPHVEAAPDVVSNSSNDSDTHRTYQAAARGSGSRGVSSPDLGRARRHCPADQVMGSIGDELDAVERGRSQTFSASGLASPPRSRYDPLCDERPASQGAASAEQSTISVATRQTSQSEASVAGFPGGLKARQLRSRAGSGSKLSRNAQVSVKPVVRMSSLQRRDQNDDNDDDVAVEEPGVDDEENRAHAWSKPEPRGTPRRKVKRWMTLPTNLGRLASAKLEWRKADESVPQTGNIGSVYRTPARVEETGAANRDSPAFRQEDSPATAPMRIFNVAILGDSGVGKTTFIQRFADDGKRRQRGIPKATIGVDYVVKNAIVAGQMVTLKLWDTAGTERFHSLAQNYLRRCDGVILMFDITKLRTFEGIRRWQDGVTQTCREGATLMVIGNKVDLVEDGLAVQSVTADDGVMLAHSMNNGMYMESSGRRGIGVDEACSILTKAMLAKEDEEMQDLPQPQFCQNPMPQASRQSQCCRG